MSTTKYVDVEQRLHSLQTSGIHPENVQAVRDFVDDCAAEGISEVRQQRHVQTWKTLLERFTPADFRMRGATEQELKRLIAALHRSDYAETTKHTMKCAVKKFYKLENGGRDQPEKTKFFTLTTTKATSVTREDLFTADERTALFRAFSTTRDRALTMVLYESAARPGELLSRNLADVTANAKGDFISLEGLKNTPDRTNQLIRAGRPLREWLAQHPFGGSLGDVENPSAPLWVKTEQQACTHCGEIPQHHDDACDYAPDLADRLPYDAYVRRFKQACDRADIPETKRRPYNLRHTRLTEVATFMGYEQLNKFAGWKPGSNRAKVYVHLNNDDVNRAIREHYGLDEDDDEKRQVTCPFCDAVNQADHSDCRQCGRPLSLEQQTRKRDKRRLIERLAELEDQGVLDELEKRGWLDTN